MRLSDAIFILSVFVLFLISSCANQQNEDTDFKELCQDAGYEWMLMKPTRDGKFIKDAEECWGCMVRLEHLCDKEKYMDYVK